MSATEQAAVGTLRADLENLSAARGLLIGAAVSLPAWVGILGLIIAAQAVLR